jgi:hypothetical protein
VTQGLWEVVGKALIREFSIVTGRSVLVVGAIRRGGDQQSVYLVSGPRRRATPSLSAVADAALPPHHVPANGTRQDDDLWRSVSFPDAARLSW